MVALTIKLAEVPIELSWKDMKWTWMTFNDFKWSYWKLINSKEEYSDLIEDILDELVDLFECQDDAKFLQQNQTLPNDRIR